MGTEPDTKLTSIQFVCTMDLALYQTLRINWDGLGNMLAKKVPAFREINQFPSCSHSCSLCLYLSESISTQVGMEWLV